MFEKEGGTTIIMGMKIKVGIVEDEIAEEQRTEEMLKRFFTEEDIPFEIFSFTKGEELFSRGFSDIDLLLFDIILPNENGVEIAKKVRTLNWNGPLIFITKTIQFALDGYKVDALDYLLKPLSYDDFRLKLLKACKIINVSRDKQIIIRTSEGTISLRESSISYVEVCKHYLTFHSDKGVYTIRGSMNKIAQSFSTRFANSSNSFLVNLDRIDLIKANDVVVNGETLPLSRNFKKELLRRFAERKG